MTVEIDIGFIIIFIIVAVGINFTMYYVGFSRGLKFAEKTFKKIRTESSREFSNLLNIIK